MTDGPIAPEVTAGRPRPDRSSPSVRRAASAVWPIWVASFVVLVGVLSASSPLPAITSGQGAAGAPTDRAAPPVLQSTANLTCQASKLLGQSCSPHPAAPSE